MAQNISMETQLKIAIERHPNITSLCDQACMIRRKIHQVQVRLVEEICKVKWEETKLNEIEDTSSNFRTKLLEVGNKVQSQLTWVESNSTFLEHFP